MFEDAVSIFVMDSSWLHFPDRPGRKDTEESYSATKYKNRGDQVVYRDFSSES